MLSGRGLSDELITRPEESYRLWCVVVCDLETSRIGAPYIYDISSLRVKQNATVSNSQKLLISLLHYGFLPLLDSFAGAVTKTIIQTWITGIDTHYCKTSIRNSDSVFEWCPFKFPMDQAHFISGLNFFYRCGSVKTLHGYHTECMAMQVERMICIKCLACSSTMFKTPINILSRSHSTSCMMYTCNVKIDTSA